VMRHWEDFRQEAPQTDDLLFIGLAL
jgi:hypothetical protein